jgi:mannonate dehydratase
MTSALPWPTKEEYGRQGKIAYIHFRNVRGKVPSYQEVFIDEGDLDMIRVARVLKDIGYDGVLVADHTPERTCDAPRARRDGVRARLYAGSDPGGMNNSPSYR